MCMLYFYGLPFVDGQSLLLLAFFWNCVRFFFPPVCVRLSMSILYSATLFLFTFVFIPLFVFYTSRVPAQSERIVIYAHYTGYCLLLYYWCCRCCSMLFIGLYAQKSCTALLLLLLHVCMVFLHGLPFVVGLTPPFLMHII